MQAALDALTDKLRKAIELGRPLRIRGGGTKDFYGQLLHGDVLDTRPLAGVTAYEPSELVVTVGAGTPLADVHALLAERQQHLPFEPPQFGRTGTVGGMVAAGLAGPARASAGGVREHVLGVQMLNGKGELLRFGGQVMKNVAGYDVSRLLAGSLGCLGALVEVSLKVLPEPPEEATLRFEIGEREALERFRAWAVQALPISASAWSDGVLHLRLSGASPALAAAKQKLGGEAVDEATAFWAGLRDQTAAFFADRSTALIRLALPAAAPALDLPGPRVLEWGGSQRWCRAGLDRWPALRDLAVAHGGHATLFRAPADRVPDEVFTPLSPPLLRIHRALKQRFDPAGVFNRGRMYADF